MKHMMGLSFHLQNKKQIFMSWDAVQRILHGIPFKLLKLCTWILTMYHKYSTVVSYFVNQFLCLYICLASKKDYRNFFDAEKPHFFNYQHRNLFSCYLSMLIFSKNEEKGIDVDIKKVFRCYRLFKAHS